MGGQIEEHPKTSGCVCWGFALHPGAVTAQLGVGMKKSWHGCGFMTGQLSWVDEVKRAGLSLIPAKGYVKAGAHICISARQTQASSAKNPGCSSV